MRFNDLIGAPFAPNGRGPAYDCWGIVREVRQRLGLPTPEFAYEASVPDNPEAVHAIITASLASPGWVAAPPVIGNILAMRWGGGVWVNHVGIIVAPDRFLHCLTGIGVHQSRLSSPLYKNLIAGVYAWQT